MPPSLPLRWNLARHSPPLRVARRRGSQSVAVELLPYAALDAIPGELLDVLAVPGDRLIRIDDVVTGLRERQRDSGAGARDRSPHQLEPSQADRRRRSG